MFPVVSPFRLRVSHHLDHATFPAGAADLLDRPSSIVAANRNCQNGIGGGGGQQPQRGASGSSGSVSAGTARCRAAPLARARKRNKSGERGSRILGKIEDIDLTL